MTSTTNTRRALMKIDPHCWWCGIYLIEIDDIANRGANSTLDHLNTKNTPTGERRPVEPGQIEFVLACVPCNAIRGRISKILFEAGLTPKNAVTLQQAIETQQKELQVQETLEDGDYVYVRLRTGTVLSVRYRISNYNAQYDTWTIRNETTGYRINTRAKYLVKDTSTRK